MRQILFASFVLLSASAAEAAPITYACRMTTNPQFTEFSVIDQIVVDREAQTFELRDANTMGTNNEVRWLFKDLGDPGDTILWRVDGDDDLVAGTRFGLPFIFRSMGPMFGLSFADGLPLVYHEWTCEP